ncbi:MFS transporter [Mesorhizobium sp.]|uniref:MFS transporter n=1 Tax=Mesorhizobium sp. TaxID=1871066 RepID=UPI000FE93057|nr:MFS transporter [Mesorhizobium sp.]RWQ59514.1 MAG: MFS transporter [Mesorhizobium sp.]
MITADKKPPSRQASFMVFLAGGIGIGAWAASLPSISAELQIDKGTLGFVLLCFAAGAILTMTNVGRLVPRFGTRTLCLIACTGFGLALIVAPHTPSVTSLGLVVAFAGASFGALDVLMNTDAAFLERRVGRHIMSSFHALFSVGNLGGAGICGLILSAGGNVQACLGVAGMGVVLFGAAGCWLSEPHVSVRKSSNEGLARLDPVQRRRLLLVGVIAFLALFSEGALMDWTAVYLVGNAGASESIGAFGFAVFAGMMAIGRMVGDAMANAFGPVRLLRLGSAASAVALAVILGISTVPVIFLALILCGFGIANVVPALFAAAGRIGGHAAGSAMSLVATLGYAGLLVGPAFIGMLAQATSLSGSLWVVFVAFAVITLAAGATRPHIKLTQTDA